MQFQRIEQAALSVAEELLGKRPPSLLGIIYSLIAAACAGGVLVACFDPTSTADLPFLSRILVWILHFAFGAVLLAGTTSLFVLANLRSSLALTLTVIIFPLILAPFSLYIDFHFDAAVEQSIVENGVWNSYLEETIAIAPPSLGMAVVLAVVIHRVAELARANRNELLDKMKPEPEIRDFIDGIPDRLGNDIIRAEAQDHYVKFVFGNGEATLKLSFENALESLAKFRGAQCHRSHWVRFRHIAKLEPSGSAYQCQLSNGDQIPVSRRKYSTLRTQK